MAINIVRPENSLGKALASLAETHLAGTIQAKRDAANRKADLAMFERDLQFRADGRKLDDTYRTKVAEDAKNTADLNRMQDMNDSVQERLDSQETTRFNRARFLKQDRADEEQRQRETRVEDLYWDMINNGYGGGGESLLTQMSPDELQLAETAPSSADFKASQAALGHLSARLEPEIGGQALKIGQMSDAEWFAERGKLLNYNLTTPFKAFNLVSRDNKALQDAGAALGLDMSNFEGFREPVDWSKALVKVFEAYRTQALAYDLKKRAEQTKRAIVGANLGFPQGGQAPSQVDTLLESARW